MLHAGAGHALRAELSQDRSGSGSAAALRRPQLRVPDHGAGALDPATPSGREAGNGDTIPAGHGPREGSNGGARHWLSDHRNPVYGQVRGWSRLPCYIPCSLTSQVLMS